MTLLHQAAQKAVEAAQAVVARWETPLWKDAPPTAKVIYKMRDAMNELESALQQPEPGELALVIEQDPESGWWRVAGTPESGIYIAHPSVDACIADILPTWRLLAETAPQQVPPVPALQHQEEPREPVAEWLDDLEADISAIDCRYRGDPSYDHDAYWMKDRVLAVIERHRGYLATSPSTPESAEKDDAGGGKVDQRG